MTYPDERARLTASHDEASNSYDRTLLTITSGALGLSIAFVKDIAATPTHRWLLLASWIVLAVTLFVLVFSHMVSVEIHKRLIAGLDEGRPYDQEPWWVKSLATAMNRAAGLTFALGIGFLISFAYINFDT